MDTLKQEKRLEQEKIFKTIDRRRRLEVSTPLEPSRIQNFMGLFPPRKSIPLTQIFSEINQVTGFLNHFEPFDSRRRSRKPDPLYFYAGLLSRTQRKGLKQLGKPFANLESRRLKETLRIYFTQESLKAATQALLRFAEDLDVTSFLETGFSVYAFPKAQEKFSSPGVICCPLPEFPYALDMLLGNPAAPPEERDILIQNPQECTELFFGIANLLNFSYALHVEDLGAYKLYGTETTKVSLKNFEPDAQVSMDVIAQNWDDIIRFAATIKTGYTSASILIPKFINRFEEPIYLGIRELGRVQQTMFLLNYINTLELRQTIEAHVSKRKYHHKLSSLIQAPLKPSEFISYENRELNAACLNLIQSCIQVWNCVYLSKRIQKQPAEVGDFRQTVKSGFIPLARHIDFSQ